MHCRLCYFLRIETQDPLVCLMLWHGWHPQGAIWYHLGKGEMLLKRLLRQMPEPTPCEEGSGQRNLPHG